MNKVKYGLKNVHVAPLNEDASGNVSFGTPRRIPGAVNLSLPPVGEKTAFYADDVEYYTAIQNAGYEGTVEIAIVPDWYKTQYLNDTEDENGVFIEDANKQPKRHALMFEFDGDKKKTRHVLYNCKASRPTIEGGTKTNTVEPKTETLNIVAKPLEDGIVKARTGAKTSAETYNGWYDNVYGQTSTAANVTPKTAEFDKNAESTSGNVDIVLTVVNDKATDVMIGDASIGSDNFTIADEKVTIKKEWLAKQPNGKMNVAVLLESGIYKTVTITISDTTAAE